MNGESVLLPKLYVADEDDFFYVLIEDVVCADLEEIRKGLRGWSDKENCATLRKDVFTDSGEGFARLAEGEKIFWCC